ncbi:hypothetical protein DFQ26_008404 [Actinomortierella ambigua]|nr:hypothetical protein DFQ26_008404 [Actinomortierella ambigua]
MAFSGTGHRLGNALPMADGDTAPTQHQVPSLVDCCLRVLERHIDMIEDIGVTPFHLIESVLRKCNELWYLHAISEFKSIRDMHPQYDQSGEWHAIYTRRRKEEDEKFARVGAKLRQSYSQHDKNRQDRQVSFDPNLRLPKRARSFRAGGVGGSGSLSSGWGAPRKPKTLFEKAKLEARRTIQMFTPFPQNRSVPSRSNSSSSNSNPTLIGRIRPPSASYTSSRYPPTAGSTVASGHSSASTRIQASIASSSTSTANASGTAPRARPKYSYKTRPVVYTSLPGSSMASSNSLSSASHASPPLSLPQSVPLPPSETPLSPATSRSSTSKSTSLAPSIPIPANANGAIANFFQELNPSSVVTKRPSTRSRSPSPAIPSTKIGSGSSSSSSGGAAGRRRVGPAATTPGPGLGTSESRSPTSPVQPASKTLEALRPHQDDEHRQARQRPLPHHQHQHVQSIQRPMKHKSSSHHPSGRTLKDLAASDKKDDYRWLEEDDDEDNNDDHGGHDEDDHSHYQHHHSHDHNHRGSHAQHSRDSEDERKAEALHPRKRSNTTATSGNTATTLSTPSPSSPNSSSHQPIAKPMTLEAAGRQFFNELLGK